MEFQPRVKVYRNFNQCRRRGKRRVNLPDHHTAADRAAGARKVFPDSGEAAAKKIAGYARLSRRDLSAVNVAGVYHGFGGERTSGGGVADATQIFG
jgi:hypothetical protein